MGDEPETLRNPSSLRKFWKSFVKVLINRFLDHTFGENLIIISGASAVISGAGVGTLVVDFGGARPQDFCIRTLEDFDSPPPRPPFPLPKEVGESVKEPRAGESGGRGVCSNFLLFG